MKICKKCHTKNDNRKKKCTYCKASLKGIKIQEDNYVYRPVHKGIFDFVEHSHIDVKLNELSKHLALFITTYFSISFILWMFTYLIFDSHIIDIHTLAPSFIRYGVICLINASISLTIAMSLIFKHGTLYEDDVNKFMIYITCFLILYSLFLGIIEYIKYSNFLWSMLTIFINILIFIILLPVIYTNLKEKLL